MRKVYIILFCLFGLMAIFGCKKIDKLTQFNMEYNETVSIPSSTGINLPFNLFSPDINSNSESEFAVNDTRKDLVEEIKLTKLDLTISSPTSGNFGFLKTIEIYLEADGLSEERIAWKENVPANAGKILELETSTVDLKEHIKKDKFKLKLRTVTDEIITSEHKINIHSVFFVNAKLLKGK